MIVVGAGVFGSAVARELARRSIDVLLVDHALPGRATSASAGGLWPVGESVGLGCGVIYHAAAAHSEAGETIAAGPEPLPDAFRDYLVASNACFPGLAQELRGETGIDIEYEPGPGLLFLMYTEQDRATALQLAGKVREAVEFLAPGDVARLEPRLTRDLAGAVLLTGEHQVNPMLLAEAFKQSAVRCGAAFRPGCRVARLIRRGDRIEGIETAEGRILAGTVVNAAGAWAGALAATVGLDVPVAPVRGQIVLTESLPRLLAVSISTPQCYLLQKHHGEVLIGSTTERAGFDVSVTAPALRSLCRGAIRAMPMLRHVAVKRTWAGLRPGTPDELPVLGPMPGVEGYVNAAGGFRTGIVASPLTGRIVAQSIAGERPCFPIEPFLAERFSGEAVDSAWFAPGLAR